MTQNELYNLLKSTGLPVAYHHFDEPPSLPYIIYLFTYSSNFAADSKIYKRFDNYQVELYSEKKDLESEQLLENVFDENDIYYDKSETYIESEEMYQVIYEIQI